MSEFGFETTADDALAERDLTECVVFITGAYSGLGRETARAMGAKGARLILSGRDATKLSATADALVEDTGARVDTVVCDLADLASIRSAAADAVARFERIDMLINNAGVMACSLARTADGFEMQFGTNHLGHFLLTNLLIPLLKKGARPRIVNLSSRGHHLDTVHFDDLNYADREYDKWEAYGQSKTANILFAVALEERLGRQGIHAFAVHPGGIMTNLGRHLSDQDIADLRARMESAASGEAGKTGDKSGGMTFKTIPQGAATTCWAATAPELEGRGGLYAEDCHIAAEDDASRTGGVRSYALDKRKAEKLWAMSEELVGETFTF